MSAIKRGARTIKYADYRLISAEMIGLALDEAVRIRGLGSLEKIEIPTSDHIYGITATKDNTFNIEVKKGDEWENIDANLPREAVLERISENRDPRPEIIEQERKPLYGVYKLQYSWYRDGLRRLNHYGECGLRYTEFRKAITSCINTKQYVLTYVTTDKLKLPLEPGDIVVSFDVPGTADAAYFIEEADPFLLDRKDNGQLREGEVGGRCDVTDIFPLNRDELEHKKYWFQDLQITRKDKRTFDVCMDIVKSDGDALEYVPDDLKTKEICEIAVKNSGQALEFVPKRFIDKEMCEMVVSEENQGYGLEFVPPKYQDYEMCKKAVLYNGINLSGVTDKLMTQELCDLAIKQSPWALEYTPAKFQNPENILSAIKREPQVIEYVDRKQLTEEMIDIALDYVKKMREEDKWNQIMIATTYGFYGIGAYGDDKFYMFLTFDRRNNNPWNYSTHVYTRDEIIHYFTGHKSPGFDYKEWESISSEVCDLVGSTIIRLTQDTNDGAMAKSIVQDYLDQTFGKDTYEAKTWPPSLSLPDEPTKKNIDDFKKIREEFPRIIKEYQKDIGKETISGQKKHDDINI